MLFNNFICLSFSSFFDPPSQIFGIACLALVHENRHNTFPLILFATAVLIRDTFIPNRSVKNVFNTNKSLCIQTYLLYSLIVPEILLAS